jgi:hypothetical protein
MEVDEMDFDYGRSKVVGQVRKSAQEEIRVSKVTRESGEYIDIRTYFAPGELEKTKDGDERLVFIPTRKGVRFKKEQLDELVAALKKAGKSKKSRG